MKVVLYTTHCPKCEVLKKKLLSNNIEFEECDDVDVMIKMGFMQAPNLKVDDKIMNFTESVKWIDERNN